MLCRNCIETSFHDEWVLEKEAITFSKSECILTKGQAVRKDGHTDDDKMQKAASDSRRRIVGLCAAALLWYALVSGMPILLSSPPFPFLAA